MFLFPLLFLRNQRLHNNFAWYYNKVLQVCAETFDVFVSSCHFCWLIVGYSHFYMSCMSFLNCNTIKTGVRFLQYDNNKAVNNETVFKHQQCVPKRRINIYGHPATIRYHPNKTNYSLLVTIKIEVGPWETREEVRNKRIVCKICKRTQT